MKRSVNLFFRAFFTTILMFLVPLMVLYGTMQAYETIKINGFAQHEKAVSFEMKSDGLHLKWFDYALVIQ